MEPKVALFDQMYELVTEDIRDSLEYRGIGTFEPGQVSGPYSYVPTRCARNVALLGLLRSLPKKYLGGDSALFRGLPQCDRSSLALQAWSAMNARCLDASNRIRSGAITCTSNIILEEASCLLHEWFGGNLGSSFPLWGLIYEFSTGPGKSEGVDGGEDFFTKIADGPITVTDKAVGSLYQRLVETIPLWAETEKLRSKLHGKDPCEVVPRLTTVPKTSVIDRTIEIGGSINVGFQLAIGSLMSSVLRTSVGIDLASQPEINRDLARRGSLERADHGMRWCTLDLHSASDSLSCGLVERLFRWLPDWLGAMAMFRTKTVSLNGESVPVHMWSSMGNGFTFPLQTLVFAALVVACHNMLGVNPWRRSRERLHVASDEKTSEWRQRVRPNFAVFGDDIIVDERIYGLLCSTLEDVGCVVNSSKSFASGPFRESCGTDWYHGYNVRPVYCESLATVQDRVSLINRLNRWSAQHSCRLFRSIRFLYESIPVQQRLLVPNYEGDDAGVHVGLFLYQLHKSDTYVSSALRRKLGATADQYVYRKYEPTRKCLPFWVRIQRYGVDKVIDTALAGQNPAGVLLTALQGSIRSGVIATRMSRVRYREQWAVTPGWGSPAFLGGHRDHWAGSYAHWEVYVFMNLLGLVGQEDPCAKPL